LRTNAAKFYGEAGQNIGDKFKQLNEVKKPDQKGNQTDVSKLHREMAAFVGAEFHENES
jgi:hypothetical protein